MKIELTALCFVFAIEGFIVSVKQIRNRELFSFEPSQPPSIPKPVSVTSCTPQDRRALAAKGDAATETEWHEMAKCIRKRYSKLQGHYVQHVSKAGGTSLCSTFKKNDNCGGDRLKTSDNCWEHTPTVNQKPYWVRDAPMQNFVKIDWLTFKNINDIEDTSCSNLVDNLLHYKNETIRATMSENWVPSDGLCQEHFLNTIAVRHPIKRLQSHYKHVLRSCFIENGMEEDKQNHPCNKFLQKEAMKKGQYLYNVTITADKLDIITDNYLLRTLSGKKLYAAPNGFFRDGNDSDKYLQNALKTLSNFDWILLMESPSDKNNLILENGVGMSKLPHANHGDSIKHRALNKASISSVGRARLEEINSFDLQLYKEAQRLHELDVESLRQLTKYRETLSPTSNPSQCCGNICH